MRTLQRLTIMLVAITLFAGLGALPLSADSITTNGYVLGTPLPPWIVRLPSIFLPGDSDSTVTAMNDSGVVVGNSDPDTGGGCCLATLWDGGKTIWLDPPDASDGFTSALDVTDSGLVLVFFMDAEIGDPNFQIYDINTGTWSDVPPLGWNHTAKLTNDKGWTIEYGNVYDNFNFTLDGREAFLLETPEPGTLVLVAFSLVALVFLKRRSPRIG
jgi:hypothetical protein